METQNKSRRRGWIGFLVFLLVVCLVGGGIFLVIKFNGNNNNSSDSGQSNPISSSETQYSVTFDMNGYRTLDNTTSRVEQNTPIASPSINRLGYNVVWSTDQSGHNLWNFSNPVTSNITLYAQWDLIMYTVNFDLNGAVGNPINSQNAHYLTYDDSNGITSKLTAPSISDIDKIGYVFGGWWLKDNDGNFIREWNFSSDLVSDNIILYAGWAFEGTSNGYSFLEYDNAIKITDYDNTLVDGTLTIPSEINGKKVLSIGDSAFRNYVDAENVVLPSNLATICDSAFYGCSAVYQLTIPNSVKSIGSMAFHSCDNLYDLNLGTGVTNIGSMAFYQCTSLGRSSKVTIPSNVISIEDNAFNISSTNNAMNNVEFKEGLEYIGKEAFSHINASMINLPDSLQYIAREAFKYTYCLGEVHIGKGIQVLGYDAFRYAQKENAIGYFHVYLKSIVPPVLANAVAFGDFTINNGTPSRANFWIIVPDGTVDTYKAASNWGTYYSTRIVTFILS